MFCRKCGRELETNAVFCAYCGTKIELEEERAAINLEIEKTISPENEELIVSENEERVWHFEKEKLIGVRAYKRVFTEVFLRGNEINITIKKGKEKQEIHQLISNLETIKIKIHFDFLNTLFSVIFVAIGIMSFILGLKGGWALFLLTALCLLGAYGKNIIFSWKDGSETVVQTQYDDNIETLLQWISEGSCNTK